MKKFLFFTFLVFYCYTSNAQQWFLSGQIVSTGNITPDYMITDAYQNTYISGAFSGVISTKNGTISAKGQADIFLTKRDDALNEIWTITIGGMGGSNAFTRVTLTNDGVLLIGAFVGSCQFSDNVTLTAQGGRDAFLAKYDFDGNFQWATHIASGTFTDAAILVDSDGNIITAGKSSTIVTFIGEGTPTPFPVGYVAKFSADGTRSWYTTISNAGSTGGVCVSVVPNGYVLGGTTKNAQTITASDKATQTISSAIVDKNYFYLIFLNKDGKYVKSVVGEGATGNDAVQLTGMTNQGNAICLGGNYQGGDFKFNGKLVGLPNAVSQDNFLLRINSTETDYDVLSQYVSSTGNNLLHNIGVRDNILYASGQLSGPSVFNYDKLNAGMFVAAYTLKSDSIVPIGAVSKISGTGTSDTRGLVFTPTGVKITGGFKNNITIENKTYTATGTNSGTYMAKGALIACIDSLGGKNIEGTNATDKTGELTIGIRGLLAASPYTITWSKRGVGALPQFNNQTSLTGLDAGEYVAKLSYNDNRSSRTRIFQVSAPNAFGIAGIVVADPSCTDIDPKGSITVTTTYAGSGTVLYTALQTADKDLQEAATPYNVTNETGVFTDCPLGRYLITIKLDGTDVSVSRPVSVIAENTVNPFNITISDIDPYTCSRVNVPDETGGFKATVSVAQSWYALVDAVTGATVERKTTGGATVYQFTDVDPSIYQVWTGIQACMQKSTNVSLLEPSAVIINSIDAVRESCSGLKDGMITVDAEGGNLGLNYTLYESVGGVKGDKVKGPQTDNDFDNLEPGDYIVSVTDGNSCPAEQAVTIASGYAVQVALDASTKQDACSDKDNGQFMVKTQGGPSSSYTYYLYAWGGTPGSKPTDATSTSTCLFDDLAATAAGYDVKAVDQVYGCSATLSEAVVIAKLDPIQATSITPSPTQCHNTATGKITVSGVKGGMGSYTVTVNAVAKKGDKDTEFVFDGLPYGTYMVHIVDDYGCSIADIPTEVTNALAIEFGTPQLAVTDVTCNGASTGQITVNASGGTTSLKYELLQDGAVYREQQVSKTFTGIPAGTGYAARVTDVNGCSATSNEFEIEEPSAILVSLDQKTNPKCYGGEDGTIKVTSSGGTGNKTYSISKADGSDPKPYQSDNLFTGLRAGKYIVTGKDANGCEQPSAEIELVNPEKVIIVSAVPTRATCKTPADGTITVTASGGTGSYNFGLGAAALEAQTNPYTFTGLAASTYSITVSDEFNCSTATDVVLERTPDPLLTAAQTQLVSCKPGLDGVITATGSAAAEGSSTFQYRLDNGSYGENSIFNGLDVGTYTVTVMDGNSCTANSPVTVRKAVNPDVSAIVEKNNVCFGSLNGEIKANSVSDGTPTEYWLRGTFEDKNTTGDFTGLHAGDYTVTVTDNFGCVGVSNGAKVTEPDASVTAQSDVKDASMPTAHDGAITVSKVAGGTAPYKIYCTNNLDVNESADGMEATFDGLLPGTYTVSVRDANQCLWSTAPVVNYVTGIEDMEANTLKIYPNPSDGRFVIEWDSKKDIRVNVEIYSMSGQLIYKTVIQTGVGGVRTTVDISRFPRGNYVLRVPELEIKQKLVVQ